MSFVSHLECARCGKQFEPGKVYNLCPCGSPLWVRYDLSRASKTLVRDQMRSRSANLWRYHEVLPITSGYRLALVYNLRRQGRGQLPGEKHPVGE